MEREFEEIIPNVWKPENKDDKIEGTLINKQKDVGINKSMIYNLETEDKKQIAIWGTTILDDRLAYVNVGEFIRITYVDTQTNKRGQPIKIFKVEKAKSVLEPIEI